MPKRIQRKRTKGWRLPPNTIYVGRPTQWGNPFNSVMRFKLALFSGKLGYTIEDVRRELRGKHLACWCPLKQLCHADVLLSIANAPK